MDGIAGIGGVTGAGSSGIESMSARLEALAARLDAAPEGSSTAGVSRDEGAGFAHSVVGAVDDLRALQSQSDALKIAAVTGDLNDIHASMIASSRASVTLELVAAVRNKGVDAFTEIMRMQA